MRVEPLAQEVTGGDTNRLYKAGLKFELLEKGKVKKDQSLGYYRPDRPPTELSST